MYKFIAGLVLAALVGLGIGATTASPAAAGNCTFGVYCGTISHYTPDDNYDDAIRIRCDFGKPATNHLLREGERSTKYCRDTDQVYVRSNEEIWCKMDIRLSGGFVTFRWVKKFDAVGWHKIADDWDGGMGCTVRRD